MTKQSCHSVGTWLWFELMEYCRERGISPADNNRLFEIVKRGREMFDDAPPEPSVADAASEPDMRHPKIQNLISQKARREIELSMIERMIDEPDFEYYGSDYDYQTALTDKAEAFVKAARAAGASEGQVK